MTNYKFVKVLAAMVMTLTMIVSVMSVAFAAEKFDPGLYTSSKGITVEKVNGKWVATRNGKIDKSYNGIAKNDNGWWLVRGGYVKFDYTGIAKNENGWWRIVGGKVDFYATGVYKNENGWFYCAGGCVDFGFTGIAGNDNGYWYIKNGCVDFNKNGTVYYKGVKWTVKNGKAVGEIPKQVKQAFGAAGANQASYKNGHKYCIAVNTKQNIVVVYKTDSVGNFTKPVKSFVCSCGKAGSTTITGTFRTTDKYTWRALDGGVYGQYATRITGHYLFHSVPYYKQDKSTLKTAEYNKLGKNASAGCVRLCVRDVKWIYDNCATGTIVFLYGDQYLQEPLIKPTPIKMNVNHKYAGWDPTDPDRRNPWK